MIHQITQLLKCCLLCHKKSSLIFFFFLSKCTFGKSDDQVTSECQNYMTAGGLASFLTMLERLFRAANFWKASPGTSASPAQLLCGPWQGGSSKI